MRGFAGAVVIVMGLCWAAFSGTCTMNFAFGKPSENPSIDSIAVFVSAVSAIFGLGVAWVGVTMVRGAKRK